MIPSKLHISSITLEISPQTVVHYHGLAGFNNQGDLHQLSIPTEKNAALKNPEGYKKKYLGEL